MSSAYRKPRGCVPQRHALTLRDMAERAERDPVLDEWRDNLAAQLRSILAIQRIPQSDLARAMGMRETALSRRLLGKVSFSAEELLFLADWMNRNIDDIMAAAKARTTSPCLSHSEQAGLERAFHDGGIAIPLRGPATVWGLRGEQHAAKLYGAAA